MIGLALRMLFGERAKYFLLLSGIGSATILMVQGVALGFGILAFSYASADNIRSPIWVVDPSVEQVNDNQPLRDTDVDRIRSVDGVAWAAPLFMGVGQVRLLSQGITKTVTLVGLDNTTLLGAPTHILQGHLTDLRLSDAVIVDERSTKLLTSNPKKPLKVGDTFEMNDHRALVVGICFAKPSFGGNPYIFTTYDRALEFVPGQRKTVTHILVIPDAGRKISDVTKNINTVTGLKALSEQEMKNLTSRWLLKNSPAPIVIAMIIVIGFIVGTIVCGQTFYNFVFENSRYLGALRAMGAQSKTLAWMIVLQAIFVGLVGYGMGLGIMSGVFLMLPKGKVPLLMLWPAPISVLVAILGICCFAALLGIFRVSRIEPAIVFRS